MKSYIDQKRANISIKFTNFCKVNRNAPLSVKLDVLDVCISSALIYAAETWGKFFKEADLCYKLGLRTALSIRQNTNTEIVFIETCRYPLHCRVHKLQIKFWLYVLTYIGDNLDSALSKVVSCANEIGIPTCAITMIYWQNIVTQ